MTELDVAETTTDPDDLGILVAEAQSAYDHAHQAAEQARQTLADAESAVETYRTKALGGDKTSASTWAAKASALDLARVSLPGAEEREATALAALRAVTIKSTVAEVSGDRLLSGEAAQAATDRAGSLIRQALDELAEFSESRNASLAAARERLDAVGAPTAKASSLAVQMRIHSEPDSPVHRLDGQGARGILLNGTREVLPNNPKRWSEIVLAKLILRILPPTVLDEHISHRP